MADMNEPTPISQEQKSWQVREPSGKWKAGEKSVELKNIKESGSATALGHEISDDSAHETEEEFQAEKAARHALETAQKSKEKPDIGRAMQQAKHALFAAGRAFAKGVKSMAKALRGTSKDIHAEYTVTLNKYEKAREIKALAQYQALSRGYYQEEYIVDLLKNASRRYIVFNDPDSGDLKVCYKPTASVMPVVKVITHSEEGRHLTQLFQREGYNPLEFEEGPGLSTKEPKRVPSDYDLIKQRAVIIDDDEAMRVLSKNLNCYFFYINSITNTLMLASRRATSDQTEKELSVRKVTQETIYDLHNSVITLQQLDPEKVLLDSF